MAMREVQLVNSDSFNGMTNYTQSRRDFQYSQGHMGPQSHVSHEAESSHESYTHTPGSTAADLTFSPWLIDVPAFTSPLSRTSSLNGSEYVSTPPVYPEPSSLYNLADQTVPPSANYMARDSRYMSNQELGWQPYLSGDGVSRSQQHLPQHPTSSWQPYDYVAQSLPPPLDYTASPYMSNVSHPAALVDLPYLCKPDTADAAVKPSDASTPSSNSDNISDSDSDDSEFDGSNSNSSRREGFRPKSGPHHYKSHIIKLGRWHSMMDPYEPIPPPVRHYVCPRIDLGCYARFARPEHLRRHIATVHGNRRDHRCKVSNCVKAFSRSDNLRDHYWTHLERGGRIGKNDKMSLAELKEILGPKEKKLIRKLKKRLADAQSKQKPQFRAKL